MQAKKLKINDLLKEKNLWQIYLSTWRIKDSKFNWICGSLVSFLGVAYSYLEVNTEPIHSLLVKLAEFGFNSAISLLGFLIAGFTIFASLAKPGLLLLMLDRKHAGSKLSYLKYNFFTLIRTFVILLVFAAFQLCIVAFGQKDGVVGVFSSLLFDQEDFLWWGNRIMIVSSLSLWTIAMLQLKSFVFNVHHFVFTMIKYDASIHNESVPKK